MLRIQLKLSLTVVFLCHSFIGPINCIFVKNNNRKYKYYCSNHILLLWFIVQGYPQRMRLCSEFILSVSLYSWFPATVNLFFRNNKNLIQTWNRHIFKSLQPSLQSHDLILCGIPCIEYYFFLTGISLINIVFDQIG